ncbi:MAG: DUF4411 family protein [Dehalococcoidales bacterium]|nr:DUF4411 family protein [Dehalococcoidales bacterium]
MPDYWLDSDSLITSKNGPYGFDIAPSFWTFITEKMSEGIILSSSLVYDELEKGDEDDLLTWAKERKQEGRFVEPDAIVQTVFRQIADYINTNYPSFQAVIFLSGADPWIISHAKAYGGKVVTFEISAPMSNKPKIPDVADKFNVKTLNIYQMVRELKISL